MTTPRFLKLSKLLSLALRHDPSALGLELDDAGWASVGSVLAGLTQRHPELAVTRAMLEEVVSSSDKQRFALSSDNASIRANQGHSVDIDLGLSPREPPTRLYHGTVDAVLEGIRSAGILRGARTHVHLSIDTETAARVAARRRGPAVILVVRAGAMHADGHVFHLSDNGVWLTRHVPPQYVD